MGNPDESERGSAPSGQVVWLMCLRLCLLLVLAAALAGCATTHRAGNAGAYRVGSPYQVAGKWYYPREQVDYNETGLASWYGPGFNGRPTADGETYDQRSLTAAHATLPLPVNVRVTNLDNGRSIVLRVNDRGPFHPGRIIDVSERAAELLGFKEAGTARVRVEYLGRATDQPYTMIASAKPQQSQPAPTSHSTTTSAPVMASMAPVPNPVPIVSSKDMPVDTGNPPLRGPLTTPVAQADLPTDSDFANAPAPPPAAESSADDVPIPSASSGQLYIQVGAFTDAHNAMLAYNDVLGLGKASVSPQVVNGQTLYRVRLGPVDDIDTAARITTKLKAHGHDGAKIVMQ